MYLRQPPDGLATILELLRAGHETGLMDRATGGPGGPTALIHSGIAQARDYDDPHGLPEKTEYLLQEWVAMYHLPNAGRDSSKAFGHFVTQMSLHGVLKTDDLITRFFRLCTQFCVDISYRALASEPSADLIRSKAFHTLDAYVRLIALLIKHSGDANNGVTKVNLLNKVREYYLFLRLQLLIEELSNCFRFWESLREYYYKTKKSVVQNSSNWLIIVSLSCYSLS